MALSQRLATCRKIESRASGAAFLLVAIDMPGGRQPGAIQVP